MPRTVGSPHAETHRPMTAHFTQSNWIRSRHNQAALETLRTKTLRWDGAVPPVSSTGLITTIRKIFCNFPGLAGTIFRFTASECCFVRFVRLG